MLSTNPFLAQTVAFFVLKLVTSIDDVLWLSPFLCYNVTWSGKIRHVFVYVAVCLLVTLEALGIAHCANRGLDFVLDLVGNESGYWDTSRILCLVASICILIYGYKEYRDWRQPDENIPGEISMRLGDPEITSPNTPLVEYQTSDNGVIIRGANFGSTSNGEKAEDAEDGRSSDANTRLGAASDQEQLSSLFVVAFFGTLDTLVLFSAVLMGKTIQWYSFLTGAMLASVVIVALSWCISLFQPFSDFMQRVPLWALLVCISLYIFIEGVIF